MCEWCGETFTVPVRRGVPPRYCRASHRQRAYEARQKDLPTATKQKPAPIDVAAFSELAKRATDSALTETDRRRPTAARARAVELLDAAVEALAVLGVTDLDDADQLARTTVVPRLVQAVKRSQRTIVNEPRKTKALLAAGDQLAGVLTGLANPEQLNTSSERIMAPVPILVPPLGAEGPLIATEPVNDHGLPDGHAIAYPTNRRSKRLHVAIESQDNDVRLLSLFLPDIVDEWSVATADRGRARTAWESLGRALTIIATGYHHPDTEPPPSLLNGGTYIGRRLSEDLARATHWRIPLDDIRHRLADASYIQTITVTNS